MKWQEWDYLVLTMPGTRPADNEERLKKLGLEGWEVVAVGVYTIEHTIYMKRPKWGAPSRS